MPDSNSRGFFIAGGTLIAVAVLGSIGYFALRPTSTPPAATPATSAPTPTPTATPTSVTAPTSAPPGAAATFASPKGDALVGLNGVPVNGTVTGLGAGDKMWLAVVADPRGDGDTYQPQDTACTVSPAGNFDCRTAYVGGPDDKGRVFDILLVRANDAATTAFAAYNAANPAAHDYPGLNDLPVGATQIGIVQVKRS